MRFVIEGNGKLDLADELLDEFVQDAEDAIGAGAGLLLAEIQRRLDLRIGTRRSSAPQGEAPEKDTAELRDSFKLIPPRVRGAVAISGIRSNHPGGNRLEHGFTDTLGIRTFPHPFLGPSMEATDEPIGALLQERLG